MAEDPMVRMKQDFIADVSETIEKISQSLAGLGPGEKPSRAQVDLLFRTVHSLKGTSGMFELHEVSALAASVEDLLELVRANAIELDGPAHDLLVESFDELTILLEQARGKRVQSAWSAVRSKLADFVRAASGEESAEVPAEPPPEADEATLTEPAALLTVKVEIGTLDAMLNLVSELYSIRLGLLGIAKTLPHTEETRRLRDDLLKLGLILNNRAGSLEESIVGARLVPVAVLFDRYGGEVRRLARQSGKRIDFETEGGDTRVDRALLDSLHDPLLHIIRNAVDHGIEPPDLRITRGKPEAGRIRLRARQEGGHLCIVVEDDGGGVDSKKVLEKAVRQGIPLPPDGDALGLIFKPGISTKRGVTDLSGRGVGLDAAKTAIESLKGMITVESRPSSGTRFSIYLPLTLAVSGAIMLEENGVPAVVPLRSVIEVLAIGRSVAMEARRSGELSYGGQSLKVLVLSDVLGVARGKASGSAVILGVGGKRLALVSQRVGGRTEVVCRALPEAMMAPAFIAGATELNDGRAALVVQPEDLLRGYAAEPREKMRDRLRMPHPPGAEGRRGGRTPALVFRDAGHTYAIALDLLREVILQKQVTRVPVLGDAWGGIFFNRGKCHGLLNLSTTTERGRETPNVAVLAYPDRCGIGIDEIEGYFEIELPSPGESTDDALGALQRLGPVRWKGCDVTVIDLGGGGRPDPVDSLDQGRGSANARL